MKNLLLLTVIALCLVVSSLYAVAADWANEGNSYYKVHTATVTNLDTYTSQLTLDGCSAVDIVYGPSVATTATVVVQMDSAAAVSHTVINSSGNIAVSGTTTTLPYGAIKLQVQASDTVSPSTVDLAVVERRSINCQKPLR